MPREGIRLPESGIGRSILARRPFAGRAVQIMRIGCAVDELSTAEGPARGMIEPDDCLLALIRWRLADP
ncbi:hypothetical protein, partial [Acinetobacter baumannii]|uniref:hypothetical protein n=1 Tax=Acinetobacter baumannii TaxID=470 RepID=UPI001C08F838